MKRNVVGTVSVLESDSSKKTGFRTRVKLILQCEYCGWETVYDQRHQWRANALPCKKCQDQGPVRRRPSGDRTSDLGGRDCLSLGGYDLPGHVLHGLSGTKAYKSWEGMMRRCYSTACSSYEDYGGRGIKVCRDWHNPLLFYCDMGDRPEGWSIERMDPDGDYCPENCIWIPRAEQPFNRRGTLAALFPDLSKSQIRELRRRLDQEYHRVYRRTHYVPAELNWWRKLGIKNNPYVYGPMPWKRTSLVHRRQEAIERGWHVPRNQ